MLDKEISAIKKPSLLLNYVLRLKIFRAIPDELYLKIKYKLIMGEKLNIKSPSSFNEKLQWLKLFDRYSEYTDLVDKYKVREYISTVLSEEYLVPLLGVYNDFSEINFNELPNEFVLKPNHTSANVYICKDKSKIDFIKLKKEVNSWLKEEYYWYHREWPYKNIRPKILCEKYMVDESGIELKDYKLLCFNGEPKIIQVMSGRKSNQYYIDHFDLNWNRVELPRKGHTNNPNKIFKPKELEKMILISQKLSENIPFCRIDLYETKKGILFGEITFFPMSGFMDFADEKNNLELGEWIKLPLETK